MIHKICKVKVSHNLSLKNKELKQNKLVVINYFKLYLFINKEAVLQKINEVLA